MPWFKVDDAFHAHPKVLALRTGPCEDTAIALWAKAGSWCASHLTDGVVPAYVLETFVRKNATKAADELVRVRLWEKSGDDYAFRSWEEYQPTSTEVRAERDAARVRMRARRRNKVGTFAACSPEHTENFDVRSSTPTRPDPTRPSANALSPRAPSGPSKREVLEVLQAFEVAWGSSLGLSPDTNYTRVKQLLEGAEKRAPGKALETIREAAKAACADGGIRAMRSPFPAFCSQPWRHLTPAAPTAAPKVLSPERQELSAAVEAVERARGTADEYAAVERHRAAKRAVAMSERPAS